MNKSKSRNQQRGAAGLHPVMWIAAIALTAFSIVGIAKLMGWIGAPAGGPDESLAAVEMPAKQDAVEDKVPAPKAQPKTSTKKPASNANTGGADYAQGSGTSTRRVVDSCGDCGVITKVRTVEVPAEGSGVGAVAGGVVGGVVGNQFGKGSGKTAATVAGAVLGGVAGHKVEEHVRSKTVYEVSLRMEDGSTRVVNMEQAPLFGEGQRVRVSGNQLLEAPRGQRL